MVAPIVPHVDDATAVPAAAAQQPDHARDHEVCATLENIPSGPATTS